jgi:hypothetical protein
MRGSSSCKCCNNLAMACSSYPRNQHVSHDSNWKVNMDKEFITGEDKHDSNRLMLMSVKVCYKGLCYWSGTDAIKGCLVNTSSRALRIQHFSTTLRLQRVLTPWQLYCVFDLAIPNPAIC